MSGGGGGKPSRPAGAWLWGAPLSSFSWTCPGLTMLQELVRLRPAVLKVDFLNATHVLCLFAPVPARARDVRRHGKGLNTGRRGSAPRPGVKRAADALCTAHSRER